jgi:hypothetical protein
MCDYSLHSTPNRLAAEGEILVMHRFPTGSMGLASPTDLNRHKSGHPDSGVRRAWWATLSNWITEQTAVPAKVPAVCIPPGAQLTLHNIPVHLQQELGVKETEPVVFAQLSASEYRYRDGVRFANGREVLLQSLQEGQRVDVICLSLLESSVEPEHRESAIRVR